MPESALTWFFLCASAFAGGVVNAIAGGGTLLTFPSLLATAGEAFGLEPGPDRPQSLQAWMADKQPVWSEIVRKHDLLPYTLEQLVGPSWAFADAAFSSPASFFESTIKIRQAGFTGCRDSLHSLLFWLRRMSETGLLPADLQRP